MSETSRPWTITVGRGKKSHIDQHKQDEHFFRRQTEHIASTHNYADMTAALGNAMLCELDEEVLTSDVLPTFEEDGMLSRTALTILIHAPEMAAHLKALTELPRS